MCPHVGPSARDRGSRLQDRGKFALHDPHIKHNDDNALVFHFDKGIECGTLGDVGEGARLHACVPRGAVYRGAGQEKRRHGGIEAIPRLGAIPRSDLFVKLGAARKGRRGTEVLGAKPMIALDSKVKAVDLVPFGRLGEPVVAIMGSSETHT